MRESARRKATSDERGEELSLVVRLELHNWRTVPAEEQWRKKRETGSSRKDLEGYGTACDCSQLRAASRAKADTVPDISLSWFTKALDIAIEQQDRDLSDTASSSGSLVARSKRATSYSHMSVIAPAYSAFHSTSLSLSVDGEQNMFLFIVEVQSDATLFPHRIPSCICSWHRERRYSLFSPSHSFLLSRPFGMSSSSPLLSFHTLFPHRILSCNSSSHLWLLCRESKASASPAERRARRGTRRQRKGKQERGWISTALKHKRRGRRRERWWRGRGSREKRGSGKVSVKRRALEPEVENRNKKGHLEDRESVESVAKWNSRKRVRADYPGAERVGKMGLSPCPFAHILAACPPTLTVCASFCLVHGLSSIPFPFLSIRLSHREDFNPDASRPL